MEEGINKKVKLEKELRYALEHEQFKLYYQIQVDSEDQPIGAEALIRWLHPKRGLILPEQFILLMEELWLIEQMGLWVLNEACVRLKLWAKNSQTRDLVLAVNVSAKQIGKADFVVQVEKIIESHAINPQRLKLEITESAMLDNIENIIRQKSSNH